jgi:hypothetical protein
MEERPALETSNRFRIERPTVEELREAWYRIDRPDSFYSKLGQLDFPRFLELHLNADEVVTFPWGMFRFVERQPQFAADGHGVFWSPRMFSNPNLCGRALFEVMNKHSWIRIQVVVPSTTRALHKWLNSVGFVFEGTLRKALGNATMAVDGFLFSVVKED